jgi:hypothetical protein
MGFTKKYLSEKSELVKEYKELGHSKFVNAYSKYDMIVGSDKSFKFLNKKLTKKTK